MNSIKKIMATTMFMAAAVGINPALASTSHMATAGKTSQPIGHAIFCKQFQQECQVRSSDTRAPELTRKRWADLVRINNHANSSVDPVTDYEGYGVEEHWTYPKSYGDCEDYVLLKRYMLIQRGWPPSSLLITVVMQPNGEGHAVLTVRTRQADYVLDNLDTKIRQWSETPYRYLKRQSVSHTGRWTRIKDRRASVASY